jgi:hypothetical protein
MEKWHELVGKRFGRLLVIKPVGIWGQVIWLCRCDCGNTKEVPTYRLKNGHTRSCGCLRKEAIRERRGGNWTHGESNSRLYNIWVGMKQRCYNRKAPNYKYYGGKEIKVCSRWKESDGYWAFRRWALNHGYRDSLVIDRIDSKKGYWPRNCQWVTQSENIKKARKEQKLLAEVATAA